MKQSTVLEQGGQEVLAIALLLLASAVGCQGESGTQEYSDRTQDAQVGSRAEPALTTGPDVGARLEPARARDVDRCALLEGEIDASSQWGSGWIVLGSSLDFLEGDEVRVTVGGTAEKILVRLLATGESPGAPVGILGRGRSVPENRVVEVVLVHNRPNIAQVSVHGGPNPWGKFNLGAHNGSATISSVEWCRPEAGEG